MGQILCRIFRCIFGSSRKQNISDDDDLEQGRSQSQSDRPFPPVSSSSSSRTSSSCLQDVEEIVKEEITSEIISTTTHLIDDDLHQPLADHHVSGQLQQQFITVKDHEEIEEEEEVEIRWIEHYNNGQKILLVGEGDFSFSSSLADAFVSASNIIATSLDSLDVVTKKYKNARSNLETLTKLGAYILYGIDATRMKLHTDLQMRKFDRIIYNFPHAGFYGCETRANVIRMHKNLVHGFFKNAGGMLRANGEVHVNHKTSRPFSSWNIEELARRNSLALTQCVDFKKEDYPGYNNKRGDGGRCDEPFPLGECSTFKFRFSPTANKTKNLISLFLTPQQLQLIQQQPKLVAFSQSSQNPVKCTNHIPAYVGTSSGVLTRDQCFRIFREYFNYLMETFKKPGYSVSYLAETMRLGFERYEAEKPGRPWTDIVPLLIQLFTV